ncbi:MAG: HAD hydrolase-like protein [Victivallaceae bacterium]|nr:HAD hydrolase-like protein [Victivallaceae bacterium]MDD4180418.1 HAD hydrolase-like protein [Victivallaceae bacterium]
MDYMAQMTSLKKKHDFFIGFDSDGCVFDTMEIKQKECFCPAFIKHYGLQAASKYAREVWEFVNLYSKSRGCNRFLALQRAIALCKARKEIIARGLDIADTTALDAWLKEENKLGNPTLITKVASCDNEELKKMLAWSLEVNERITDMVYGIPPFPGVKEIIETAKNRADMVVVSQTPLEALSREWKENKIDGYLELICGQEHGTKTEHLKYCAVGKYEANKILMIGDAPGDQKAAQSNGVLFFPIIPGHEEECWSNLNNEGLAHFFNGTYVGAYQDELIAEFDKALPKNPDW